MILFYYIKI